MNEGEVEHAAGVFANEVVWDACDQFTGCGQAALEKRMANHEIESCGSIARLQQVVDLKPHFAIFPGGRGSSTVELNSSTGVAIVELFEEDLAEQLMEAEAPRLVANGHKKEIGDLQGTQSQASVVLPGDPAAEGVVEFVEDRDGKQELAVVGVQSVQHLGGKVVDYRSSRPWTVRRKSPTR